MKKDAGILEGSVDVKSYAAVKACVEEVKRHLEEPERRAVDATRYAGALELQIKSCKMISICHSLRYILQRFLVCGK